jgi:hypothetical protein
MRASRLAVVHGAFYVATGLWPIIHLRSFERVTGAKTDKWLVRTVGGLVTAIGTAMLVGARRREGMTAARVLGIGSAITFALIDVVYASRGRISRVYYADAAVEGALAAGWLAAR